MKCDYCGAEVSAGKKYCIQCGARIREEERLWRDDLAEQLPVVPAVPVAPVAPVASAAPAVPAKSAPQAVQPVRRSPAIQLPVERGLGKMFFLGILTLGIYPMVIWSRIVTELNLVASSYDGKRTVSFFGMTMLAPITLGIYGLVWIHNFCRRIGDELNRRNLGYQFGPSDFWLWNVLGSLILVGPFIFNHKLMKSMNKLNADFNVKG